MNTYSAWNYLLIDAANQFDLDKLTFEQRIEWATKNLAHLEDLIEQAPKKTKPLFIKAVMAIRKAQQGIATGHMVGLDAACSGMQLMSCMTGCIDGARATGLVDPDRRADAYGEVTAVMRGILGMAFEVSRKQAKDATMTSFYGSKATPKNIFGEDTPELNAFYEAIQTVAPGAWELLQDLLGAWQPYALQHAWKLPDGFDARVKVMEKKEVRIEVDELGHSSFTYEFYENQGQKKGISLPANVTHSVDAYVLREMHRRCNYDRADIEIVHKVIDEELQFRINGSKRDDLCLDPKVTYYKEQYERSKLASAVILPHLTAENVTSLGEAHLMDLYTMTQDMLRHPSFELVTVHDEFKAHPNHCNQLRWHYKEILAEIADSTLIDDVVSQIVGEQVTFTKFSAPGVLSQYIRNSNYALT